MTWTQVVRTQAAEHSRGVLGIAAWRFIVLAASVSAWYLIHVTGALPAGIAPNPADVVVQFVTSIVTPEYWVAVGATLGGALYGLVAAIVVGIPIGVLTGRFLAGE